MPPPEVPVPKRAGEVQRSLPMPRSWFPFVAVSGRSVSVDACTAAQNWRGARPRSTSRRAKTWFGWERGCSTPMKSLEQPSSPRCCPSLTILLPWFMTTGQGMKVGS